MLDTELFGQELEGQIGIKNIIKGKLEISDKGTLFLEEIDKLPTTIQIKLLRTIQEKRLQKIDGMGFIPLDVRLISATNKNLQEEINQGRFREDLYYKLNVVKIKIPALKERTDDIPLWIEHFLKHYTTASQPSCKVSEISPRAVNILCNYKWNGNVEELENAIAHAVVFCKSNVIIPADLPSHIQSAPISYLDLSEIPDGLGLAKTLAEVEKKLILNALKISGNIQSEAAKILGISKSGLHQKLKKYNIHIFY
jgi:two-component system NtrC family response regulator